MSEPQVGLIYGKIAAIMAEVGPIAKEKYNEGQKYNFRGIDQIYNAVHPIMVKHRVFPAPEVLDHKHTVTVTENKGFAKEVVRSVIKTRVRFYAEDGSNIFVDVIGEGADHGGDKASNKAMSGAMKYAVMQVLMIPTEMHMDSEADERIGRGPASEEDVGETAGVILKKKFAACSAETDGQKDAIIRYLTAGKITLVGIRQSPDLLQELLKAFSRERNLKTLLERAEGRN
jgi:hypothetical protein